MKREVSVYDLRSGMIVSEDVMGKNGQLLVRRGVTLTNDYIHRLKRLGIKRIAVSKPDPHDAQTRLFQSHSGASASNTAPTSKPPYLNAFHQELLAELPLMSRKILSSPALNHQDREQILTHLKFIIGKPDVLDGLFKLKLIEENLLKKALQVAMLATAMGRLSGLMNNQLANLTTGALLYDLGNFWISRSILSKPAPLDEKEKRLVEEHTFIGYSALINDFDEEVARIAYQHHERHDGSGYPGGMSGDKIDLSAKIVSICDVYVSMITPRPFRQRYEPIEVMEYILAAGGTLFDPKIVDLFLQVMPLYSAGSIVELSNGCIGIVVQTDARPLGRPVVEILFDEYGRPVQNQYLDLMKHLTISIKRIL